MVRIDTYQEFLFWMIKRATERKLLFSFFSPIITVFYSIPICKKHAINMLTFIAFFGEKKPLISILKLFVNHLNHMKSGFFYSEALKLFKPNKDIILSGCPEWLVKFLFHSYKQTIPTIFGSIQKIKNNRICMTNYCYANNKVKRLNIEKIDFKKIEIGYSDSISDTPFLLLCRNQFIINPKNELKYEKKLPNSCTFLKWY